MINEHVLVGEVDKMICVSLTSATRITLKPRQMADNLQNNMSYVQNKLWTDTSIFLFHFFSSKNESIWQKYKIELDMLYLSIFW